MEVTAYLREKFYLKNPKYWAARDGVLLHDNTQAHWSLLEKQLTMQVTVELLHPLNYCDLAPFSF
jgi:hypothetical protein